jgi:hypothetical protein
MYVSPLFNLMLRYAEELQPDSILILSAKHGLLEPDMEIDPYDVTLNDMPLSQVKEWAGRVIEQLGKLTDLANDHFVILASTKYRTFLTPQLCSVEVPLEGLRIGEQLHWLKNELSQ